MSTQMNTELLTTPIYTEDLKGNATYLGKPCRAVAHYDLKIQKIRPLDGTVAKMLKKLGKAIDKKLDQPNIDKYKVYYNTLSDPDLSPWAEHSETFIIVDSKEDAIAIVSAISQVKLDLIKAEDLIKAKEKAEKERLNGTKDRPKVSIQSSIAPTNPWHKKVPTKAKHIHHWVRGDDFNDYNCKCGEKITLSDCHADAMGDEFDEED
jgi:hypothetical protein